jgi:hypothetical protein
MPSYEFASIPVTIKTSRDTEIAPHSASIYANSTFPFEFIRVNKTSSAGTERSLEIKGEDKITQSSLMIDVEAPLSLTDQISEFWNKLGKPLSFLCGVVAGLSLTIYNLIKKKLGK